MLELPGVRITLLGVRVQDRPVDGDVEELKFTVPGKALTEATVIVAVVAEPALVVRPDGLAPIEKSCTFML